MAQGGHATTDPSNVLPAPPALPPPLSAAPKPPASGFLVLFSPRQWEYLVANNVWQNAQLAFLVDNQRWQDAAIEVLLTALGPMTSALEGLMTESEQLTAQVAEVKANLAAIASSLANVATEIRTEISDLAAAVAAQGQPNVAVTAAIESLQTSNAGLADLATKATALAADLAADNRPATP